MKIREQDLPRGPATVFRRLAALVYDGLLLLAAVTAAAVWRAR